MTADRRTSTVPPLSESIPTPPPLPPQKARSVVERLGWYSGKARAPRPTQDGTRTPPTSAPQRNLGTTPQHTSFKISRTEVRSVAISPDQTRAVLAGRNIFKIITVEGSKCTQDRDLREEIVQQFHIQSGGKNDRGTPQDSQKFTGPRDPLSFNFGDVAWSHSEYRNRIAAAVGNDIGLYDVEKEVAGNRIEYARLKSHPQVIHRIAFNPFAGHLLLAGGHDGTAKLWDIRTAPEENTSKNSTPVTGNGGTVWDARWSPTDGVQFATGTESGSVFVWDYRNLSRSLLRITAHDRACYSIDWHPDGKHFVSAGRDRTVKVWDSQPKTRRQKPPWQFRTPFPVRMIRWRPPCMSDAKTVPGYRQCTQLATSYESQYSSDIHVWDFRRCHLPYVEIHRYNTVVDSLLWRERDLLWAVGDKGWFTQTDVQFSSKTLDKRSLQAPGLTPQGNITYFTAARSGKRRGQDFINYDTGESFDRDAAVKQDSPEKLLGRISVDESIDESFLSSSFQRRAPTRTPSTKSTKSLSGTPPTNEAGRVISLRETLEPESGKVVAMRKQDAFRGPLLGTADSAILTFLAQKYKYLAVPDPPTVESLLNVERAFFQNADYAQRAGYHRLAQSWRIIGQVISNEFKRRAYERRRLRLLAAAHARKGTTTSTVAQKPLDVHKEVAATTPAIPAVRAIQAADPHLITFQESTSNVPTPLARPITDLQALSRKTMAVVPQIEYNDKFELGPSKIDYGFPNAKGGRPVKDARRPGLEAPHWYSSADDLSDRLAMMNSWRPQPKKEPLDLEVRPPKALNIPPPLDRHNSHDSNESFPMFSASTDSQKNSMQGSLGVASASMGPPPQRWEDRPEYSRESSSSMESSTGSAVDPLSYSTDSPSLGIDKSNPIPVQGAVDGLQIDGGEQPVKSSSTTPGAAQEREKMIQDMDTLRKHNQQIQNSASDSETFLSASNASSFDLNGTGHSEHMEASGTIVPDEPTLTEARQPSPTITKPTSLRHNAGNAPAILESTASLASSSLTAPLIPADFLSTDVPVDVEIGTPFTVVSLFLSLIEYHAVKRSDAQTAAHAILLATSLLPPTHPLEESHISAMRAMYTEQLLAVGLTLPQVKAVIRTTHKHLHSIGLPIPLAENILLTYHDQLVSLKLLNSAAYVRRLAYPTYPAVYEQALKDNTVGLVCTQCKSPINNPLNQMLCETCKGRQAPCPICNMPRSPFATTKQSKSPQQGRHRPHIDRSSAETSRRPSFDQPTQQQRHRASSATADEEPPAFIRKRQPQLYTSCLLCGHTSHSACLSTWFKDPVFSEGACPVTGCLCDCIRGQRRDERLARLQERDTKGLGLAVAAGAGAGAGASGVGRTPVVGEEMWRVGESRAVGRVRREDLSLVPLGAGAGGDWEERRGSAPGELVTRGGAEVGRSSGEFSRGRGDYNGGFGGGGGHERKDSGGKREKGRNRVGFRVE